MKKNDLNNIDAAMGAVNSNLSNMMTKGASNKGVQPDLSAAEKEEREANRRTQGRKGCAGPRITMVFSTTNYNFIRTMARIKGQSLAEFTNEMITQYIADHGQYYEQAAELVKKMEGGN